VVPPPLGASIQAIVSPVKNEGIPEDALRRLVVIKATPAVLEVTYGQIEMQNAELV
jgi:hypothetical protein